jgi:hypothetical protein
MNQQEFTIVTVDQFTKRLEPFNGAADTQSSLIQRLRS